MNAFTVPATLGIRTEVARVVWSKELPYGIDNEDYHRTSEHVKYQKPIVSYQRS